MTHDILDRSMLSTCLIICCINRCPDGQHVSRCIAHVVRGSRDLDGRSGSPCIAYGQGGPRYAVSNHPHGQYVSPHIVSIHTIWWLVCLTVCCLCCLCCLCGNAVHGRNGSPHSQMACIDSYWPHCRDVLPYISYVVMLSMVGMDCIDCHIVRMDCIDSCWPHCRNVLPYIAYVVRVCPAWRVNSVCLHGRNGSHMMPMWPYCIAICCVSPHCPHSRYVSRCGQSGSHILYQSTLSTQSVCLAVWSEWIP